MEIRRKVQDLLPYDCHRRFRFYFERYGCVRCERKNVIYGCSGLCERCLGLVSDRLKRGDKKIETLYRASRARAVNFLRRRDCARELLADLQRFV